MKLDDIINEVIYMTLQAAKGGDDQEIANIHTWAHNRLSGYDDNGNKVAYGYSAEPILKFINKRGEE